MSKRDDYETLKERWATLDGVEDLTVAHATAAEGQNSLTMILFRLRKGNTPMGVTYNRWFAEALAKALTENPDLWRRWVDLAVLGARRELNKAREEAVFEATRFLENQALDGETGGR